MGVVCRATRSSSTRTAACPGLPAPGSRPALSALDAPHHLRCSQISFIKWLKRTGGCRGHAVDSVLVAAPSKGPCSG